ncbi:hypothetical protein ONO39_26920, partial [Salmonella enterica subsp. enterica serovar Anatum]|nr:hypothetical protein [Salmonella enterica subsp. enterica serovar Anatum]
MSAGSHPAGYVHPRALALLAREGISTEGYFTSEPRPTVLVFDSGVGGLSVYDEIRRLLPDLHYIYAFDNVAFP